MRKNTLTSNLNFCIENILDKRQSQSVMISSLFRVLIEHSDTFINLNPLVCPWCVGHTPNFVHCAHARANFPACDWSSLPLARL